MKKIFLLLLLLNTKTDALSITEPYDIGEYFLLFPEVILKLNQQERIDLLTFKDTGDYLLKCIDYQHGFMEFHTLGDGSGELYEITYYVKKDQTRLIAFNVTSWAMRREDSELHFYQIKQTQWKDMTSEVMPKIKLTEWIPDRSLLKLIDKPLIHHPPLRFYLPQKGKTIKVRLSEDSLAYEFEENKAHQQTIMSKIKWNELDLIWENDRFNIANKRKVID